MGCCSSTRRGRQELAIERSYFLKWEYFDHPRDDLLGRILQYLGCVQIENDPTSANEFFMYAIFETLEKVLFVLISICACHQDRRVNILCQFDTTHSATVSFIVYLFVIDKRSFVAGVHCSMDIAIFSETYHIDVEYGVYLCILRANDEGSALGAKIALIAGETNPKRLNICAWVSIL